MRTRILALPLFAAACVSPGGVDADNAATVEAEANAAESELLPPSEMSILMGRCAEGSWVSGALSVDGNRHKLRCEMMSVAYLGKRPGYADTDIGLLQKDEAARFAMSGLWQAEDRVAIRAVRLGDGAAVDVLGECKGRFVRPPESQFENGGMGLPGDRPDPGDDAAPPAKIDCTVTDLQGNVIGAISFSER